MKESLKGLSFTEHWIKIRIEGFRPERLLNLLVNEKAPARNVKWVDETEIRCVVTEIGLELLKRKNGNKYKLTIMEEGGGKPAIANLRKRKRVVAGLLIFLAMVILQSAFVKEIDIKGCRAIPEAGIREVLREEGLYEGGLKSFSCEEIEERLFMDFDRIVWSRVAYEGGFVQVEIVEKEQFPKKNINWEKPCNIVAERDCYIENILSYSGNTKVSKNQYVKKGKVLISGKNYISHPTYYEGDKDVQNKKAHYVHSYGKIIGRVPYYYSIVIGDNTDEKGAKELLYRWIEKNIPQNAQILNKSLKFSREKNIIRIYGVVETRQRVGVEKEILVDKHKDRNTEKNSN